MNRKEKERMEEYLQQYPLAVGFRVYNPMMKIVMNEKDCEVEICNRKYLNTRIGFIDKDKISECCKCIKSGICKQIVDLLLHDKYDEANALIQNL